MKMLYPALTGEQQARVRALLAEIEDLNRRLAMAFHETTAEALDIDFVTGNPSAAVQLKMTMSFAEKIFAADGTLHTVDEVMDDELRELITHFAGVSRVHGADAPLLSAAVPSVAGSVQ
jgi:hypothetical protein